MYKAWVAGAPTPCSYHAKITCTRTAERQQESSRRSVVSPQGVRNCLTHVGDCLAHQSFQNALAGFKRPVAWHASGPARRRAYFRWPCPHPAPSALSSREHLEHGVPQVLVVGLAPVGFDVLIERVRSGPSMAHPSSRSDPPSLLKEF